LLEVLERLVKLGNTVLVIEHNLDVINTADYLIDLGPEGGDRGGTVIATGTPEEVAGNERSYTGAYLVPVLRDERAVGHHRPDDAELERLERENLFALQDLGETGRVAVEA
jgi:excinuclease ABC subunit A